MVRLHRGDQLTWAAYIHHNIGQVDLFAMSVASSQAAPAMQLCMKNVSDALNSFESIIFTFASATLFIAAIPLERVRVHRES